MSALSHIMIHVGHTSPNWVQSALTMTGDLIPIEKKAKKSKSTEKVMEPGSAEDQPILKTSGGKSGKLFRLLYLTDGYQFN